MEVLSRDEWVGVLAAKSVRFRTAMAIAAHEQSEMDDLIKRAQDDAALTAAEIQMILLSRGGEG